MSASFDLHFGEPCCYILNVHFTPASTPNLQLTLGLLTSCTKKKSWLNWKFYKVNLKLGGKNNNSVFWGWLAYQTSSQPKSSPFIYCVWNSIQTILDKGGLWELGEYLVLHVEFVKDDRWSILFCRSAEVSFLALQWTVGVVSGQLLSLLLSHQGG